MSDKDRALMIEQAEFGCDFAAELLARESMDVRWIRGEFQIDIDNTTLGWNMEEGWDGPSHTADVLARMVINATRIERERCALLAEHCAHSCVTEGHCDALHAAHGELAAQIRDRGTS